MIKETWKYSQIASGGNLFLTVHVTQEIQLVFPHLREVCCWRTHLNRLI
ncbi:unnamed protein product [Larinioides sclopetarius]|uniref:Uncharacterized protein n=1 Tax=Larinioides sclopetarius TaxID=280406 RepID=A0AAV2BKW7_9ARAC